MDAPFLEIRNVTKLFAKVVADMSPSPLAVAKS
jgi:hypothetical protein